MICICPTNRQLKRKYKADPGRCIYPDSYTSFSKAGAYWKPSRPSFVWNPGACFQTPHCGLVSPMHEASCRLARQRQRFKIAGSPTQPQSQEAIVKLAPYVFWAGFFANFAESGGVLQGCLVMLRYFYVNRIAVTQKQRKTRELIRSPKYWRFMMRGEVVLELPFAKRSKRVQNAFAKRSQTVRAYVKITQFKWPGYWPKRPLGSQFGRSSTCGIAAFGHHKV